MSRAGVVKGLLLIVGLLALLWLGLQEPVEPDENDCLARGAAAKTCGPPDPFKAFLGFR